MPRRAGSDPQRIPGRTRRRRHHLQRRRPGPAHASSRRGYVLKSRLATELPRTIRDVHAGRKHIDPEVAAQLAEQAAGDGRGRVNDCRVLDIRTVLPRLSEIASTMLPHDALAVGFLQENGRLLIERATDDFSDAHRAPGANVPGARRSRRRAAGAKTFHFPLPAEVMTESVAGSGGRKTQSETYKVVAVQ